MLPNKVFFLAGFLYSSLSFSIGSLPNLEKKINSVVEKKVLIDLQLVKLQDEIVRLETDIRNQRKILIQRTRALGFLKDFKWGGLLAADDPNMFERNLLIMKRLNQYDVKIFKDYRNSLKKLSYIRKDLKSNKLDLEKTVADLKEQEVLIFQAENQEIQKNILEQKDSLLKSKGALSIPIHRPVSQFYGSMRDGTNQYAMLVRGLIFSSQAGDHVQSVGPGKVIFSDHIPRWGDAIIVQHSDNYYSVYAGLDKLKKNVNELVGQNDLIADAGPQNFYFELRHFDEPINPKKWFKNTLLATKEVR